MSVTPARRILLCLDECAGEFYLPLSDGEHPSCPTDSTHAVAIYTLATVEPTRPDTFDDSRG